MPVTPAQAHPRVGHIHVWKESANKATLRSKRHSACEEHTNNCFRRGTRRRSIAWVAVLLALPEGAVMP
eukprot:scaffold143596_cov33-Tisochrysis_lutea.AAC.2